MTPGEAAGYAAVMRDDHPPFSYPDYKSTAKRFPHQPMVAIIQTLSETTGPGVVWAEVSPEDADLTTNAGTGSPAIGERIIVTGRVLGEDGEPVPGTLLEIWQANACGRYTHWRETEFTAPLDPNFLGVGQTTTDEAGEVPLHHHQARPLSLGEPPQRLAPGAHPLLPDGACPWISAGHPDVLRRGPAVAARPDLQLGAGALAASHGRDLRP